MVTSHNGAVHRSKPGPTALRSEIQAIYGGVIEETRRGKMGRREICEKSIFLSSKGKEPKPNPADMAQIGRKKGPTPQNIKKKKPKPQQRHSLRTRKHMFYLAGAPVVGMDLGAGVDEEDLLRARPACKHARFISSSPRRTKKKVLQS
jgi:hypothetical protein